jgi:hypothetical protein
MEGTPVVATTVPGGLALGVNPPRSMEHPARAPTNAIPATNVLMQQTLDALVIPDIWLPR